MTKYSQTELATQIMEPLIAHHSVLSNGIVKLSAATVGIVQVLDLQAQPLTAAPFGAVVPITSLDSPDLLPTCISLNARVTIRIRTKFAPKP
jgi:hypothetical protein